MIADALYRRIWRWHFYAGLFVLPFVLLLSVTGSIYLFKPQIDRWEERDFRGLGTRGAVSADAQLESALAAFPGASFNYYRLPERPGDAAVIALASTHGEPAQVFVSPQGQVLGTLDPRTRISEVVKRLHGELLLGKWGDRLVELVASWTIVMILTGLYLWWPRPFRLAGTLWPRLSLRGRPLLKDIHRTIGFWIAGLVLVMLASGLPWAGTWGSAFAWTRAELGLMKGAQQWEVGAADDTRHHHATPILTPAGSSRPASGPPLSTFVAKADAERMAYPVEVLPPFAPQLFGPPTGDEWTAQSMAQNRRLVRSVTYDPRTGAETGRTGFADKHVIDQVVQTGIAWHEGQLLGLANQLVGVATALALIGISILGAVMWLRRRPRGRLGAPPAARGATGPALVAAVALLGVLMPLFGASVAAITVVDGVVRLARRGRSGAGCLAPSGREVDNAS